MIYNFEVEAITSIDDFLEDADVSYYEWTVDTEYDVVIVRIDLTEDRDFRTYRGKNEMVIEGERYIGVYWGDESVETYLREDVFHNLHNLYVIAERETEHLLKARSEIYSSASKAQIELERLYPDYEYEVDYRIVE